MNLFFNIILFREENNTIMHVYTSGGSKGGGGGGQRHTHTHTHTPKCCDKYKKHSNIPLEGGARCSSVVRAFAHGAMGRRINPSWWNHWAIFLVPASTPRLVQQMPWYVLYCMWDDAYKRILAANRRRVANVAGADFFSLYRSGPLPYVRRHIKVNKMCWMRR